MADQRSQDRNPDAKRRMDEDKQRISQNREQLAKVQEEERERSRGTPTPTQEEADLIMLGHHPELAEDGSEQDPNVGFSQAQLEGERGSGGGYENRTMGSAHQRTLPHQGSQHASPSHQAARPGSTSSEHKS